MLRRTIIALAAITIFMSVTTLAGPPKTGCKKFSFTGSFLSPSQDFDVFGDGSLFHSFAFQLTLNSDGSANQYWTGLPDYLLNAGSGSPQIGSWTCRDDGKLIITLISATYVPAAAGSLPNVLKNDLRLTSHSRTTYLFSVDDDNTLTRTQSRTRRYTPAQDPTDAAGGSLLAANPLVVSYTRLVASDADLLAP
jgi:hypothetical protein